MFLGSLVYGFINSAILALIAVGFNLTFGISGVANFAYGAIYIFSGFFTWIFLHSLGLNYLLCIAASVFAAALVGMAMYYTIILGEGHAPFRSDGNVRARSGNNGAFPLF